MLIDINWFPRFSTLGWQHQSQLGGCPNPLSWGGGWKLQGRDHVTQWRNVAQCHDTIHDTISQCHAFIIFHPCAKGLGFGAKSAVCGERQSKIEVTIVTSSV
jgi:hypothetical protein